MALYDDIRRFPLIINSPNWRHNGGLVQRSGHMRADMVSMMRQMAAEYRHGPDQIPTTGPIDNAFAVVVNSYGRDLKIDNKTYNYY